MLKMTPEIKKQLLDLGRDLEKEDFNEMLKKLVENSMKVMKILGRRPSILFSSRA